MRGGTMESVEAAGELRRLWWTSNLICHPRDWPPARRAESETDLPSPDRSFSRCLFLGDGLATMSLHFSREGD
jgi:hypothetical protein